MSSHKPCGVLASGDLVAGNRPGTPSGAGAGNVPATRRSTAPAVPPGGRADGREERPLDPKDKMVIVGRAVTLTGALSDCDVLVVEGRVDAHISASRAVEVAETGVFRAAGEVEEAIVRGWLDGDLTVSRRLLVRATGRVTGNIRYRDLQIEHGGRVAGTLLPLDDD